MDTCYKVNLCLIVLFIQLVGMIRSEYIVSFKFLTFEKGDGQPFSFDICFDQYHGNKDNFDECPFDQTTTEIIQMTGDKIVFNQTLLSLQKAITIKVPDTDEGFSIKVKVLIPGRSEPYDKYFQRIMIPPLEGKVILQGGIQSRLVVSFLAKRDNSLSEVQTIGLITGLTIFILIILITIIVLAVLMVKKRRTKQHPDSRDDLVPVSQHGSEDIDDISTVHHGNPRSRSNTKGQDTSKHGIDNLTYEDVEEPDENNESQVRGKGNANIGRKAKENGIAKESPPKGGGISEDVINARPHEEHLGDIGRYNLYTEESGIYTDVDEPEEITENKYNQEKEKNKEETETNDEGDKMGYKSGPKSDEDLLYAVSAKSSSQNESQNLGEVRGPGDGQKGESEQGILPPIEMELTSVEGVDEDETIYAEIEFPPVIPPREYDDMYRVTYT